MGTFLRRRRFIINPSFQLRSALIGMLFLFVLALAFGLSIFYPLQRQFHAAGRLDDQLLISREILILHKRLWPGVLIAEILVGIFIVFTTHRVAGPLYRLEQAVKDLLRGNYAVRVILRKTDECKELSGCLNALARNLEAARDQNEKLLQTCVSQLQEAERMIARDGCSDARVQEVLHGVISKLQGLPNSVVRE